VVRNAVADFKKNLTPELWKAFDLLSQCGDSSPEKRGLCANTITCLWMSRLLVARGNSSAHDSLPQNFQVGVKTFSSDRHEGEIPIITAQLW